MPHPNQKAINRRRRKFEQKGSDERSVSPEVIQTSSNRKAWGMKIFKIIGYDNRDYLYKCYEQKLDADAFYSSNPLVDKNQVEVLVCNIAEVDSSSHQFDEGDYLVAFRVFDDEGNGHWMGFSPKYSWWHA